MPRAACGSVKTTLCPESSSTSSPFAVPSTKYAINASVYAYPAHKPTLIADTGTSLILLPEPAVAHYYAHVPGASYASSLGGYVFPCASKLPSLSVMLGTRFATIPPALMNFARATSDGKKCFGSLQSAGSSSMGVLGDVFFNAYYAVFDVGAVRFGWAKLRASA